MCLETIQSLTLCLIKDQKKSINPEKIKYLEHFLEYLLQEIVTTTTTISDLFDTLAGTIYTLICAYQNQFYQILGQMKQQDESLSDIIDKFVQDIGQKQEYNRRTKISFTVKFESFVTDLRRIMKK
jgi:predicted CopG family antitoxin